MPANTNSNADPGAQIPADLDRIDPDDERSLHDWARRFDATAEQVLEAVQAVGERAGDVEMHLKGSRASTNARIEAATEGRR